MSGLWLPKPLAQQVELSLSNLPQLESLDELLKHEKQDSIADYLAFDRRLIIEKKEFRDSPQQRKKGWMFEQFCAMISEKYQTSWCEISKSGSGILSKKDIATYSTFRDAFCDVVKDKIHKSNSQIRSTKRILGLSHSIGISLFIFDNVTGIFSEPLRQRITRCLMAERNGEWIYPHVDVVVCCIRLKDMIENGSDHLNMYIPRNSDNEQQVSYARKILDALRFDFGVRWRRRCVSADLHSDVQTKRPFLFT